MKKLFLLTALVCFPAFATIGCGPGENTVVEEVPEPTMSADQRAQYEQSMREGGSSRPGN